MVWVGPKKDGNWEIMEKWHLKIGRVQQNAKMYLSFFCWWIFGVPDLSSCQLLGLRTCIFTVEQNTWPCHVVPPVDLQGGSTMTNWFSWSPGGVELRDFPLAMIIIFINEAPKKNPNHSAWGGCFSSFPSFTTKKMRKMNPSFEYHIFSSIW